MVDSYFNKLLECKNNKWYQQLYFPHFTQHFRRRDLAQLDGITRGRGRGHCINGRGWRGEERRWEEHLLSTGPDNPLSAETINSTCCTEMNYWILNCRLGYYTSIHSWSPIYWKTVNYSHGVFINGVSTQKIKTIHTLPEYTSICHIVIPYSRKILSGIKFRSA